MSQTREFKLSLLDVIGVFCVGVIFQMIFNIPNRPWFDDEHVYRGDRVTNDSAYYGECDYGTVKYIHTDGTAAVLWHCPKHSDFRLHADFLDVMKPGSLSLKRGTK